MKRKGWLIALIIVAGVLVFLGVGLHVGLKAFGKTNDLGYVADSAYLSLFKADSNAATRAMKKELGGTALGVCHPHDDDYNVNLLSEANIGWVRYDISCSPYEFDDEGDPVLDENGKIVETQNYKNFKARCQIYRNKGIKIMAVTPYPDDMLEEIGELEFFEKGGDDYSEKFKKIIKGISAYYAQDLTVDHDLVNAFQISNELVGVDKWQGALTVDQVCEYLDLQMSSMHSITKAAGVPIGYNLVGYNLWSYPNKMLAYKDDYDYIALDLYLGCFESVYKTIIIYDLLLRHLFNLTGKPVFLNEFGYISAGQPKSEEERAAYLLETFGEEFSTEAKIKANITGFIAKWKSMVGEPGLIKEAERKLEVDGEQAAIDYIFADDQIAHLYKALPDGYELSNYPHTPEGQANFYTDVIGRLSKLDFVCGMFCYCYADSKTCYQCNQEGCPVETGWGLVSITDGATEMNSDTVYLKPSYYAVQKAFGKIKANDQKKYGN